MSPDNAKSQDSLALGKSHQPQLENTAHRKAKIETPLSSAMSEMAHDCNAQTDSCGDVGAQGPVAPALVAADKSGGQNPAIPQLFSLDNIQYCCFHSPFNKLVRKAFAQLQYIDQLRDAQPRQQGSHAHVSAAASQRVAGGAAGMQNRSADDAQHNSAMGAENIEMGSAAGSTQTSENNVSVIANPEAAMQSFRETPGNTAAPLDDQLHQQSHLQQQHAQWLHSSQHEQIQQEQLPSQQQQTYPLQQQEQHQHRQQQLQQQQQQQQEESAWLLEALQGASKDRKLEKAITDASSAGYEQKVAPGCRAGIQLGNLYAGMTSNADVTHVMFVLVIRFLLTNLLA